MNQGIKKIARFIFKIFCLQIKSNFSKSKFLKINKKNFRFLFSIHLNIFKISNNGTKCIKSIRKLSITVTHFAIFSNKNHICLCIWTISLKLKMKINFFIKNLMLFKIIHFWNILVIYFKAKCTINQNFKGHFKDWKSKKCLN